MARGVPRLSLRYPARRVELGEPSLSSFWSALRNTAGVCCLERAKHSPHNCVAVAERLTACPCNCLLPMTKKLQLTTSSGLPKTAPLSNLASRPRISKYQMCPKPRPSLRTRSSDYRVATL